MENNKNINKTSVSKGVKLFGGFLTAGLLMFGSASFAQERDNVVNPEVDEFNQYDTNTDQSLDRDEFDTRMGEDRTFDAWDTDRDGILNEDEFNEGTRNWRDQRTQEGLNTEGGVLENEGEATEGVLENENNTTEGVMGEENEALNNEGISNDEIGERNFGTFNDWDTDRDGSINRDEYNEGVYKNWDTNQDGALDTNEFNEGNNNFGIGTEEESNINEGTETETEFNEETETDINIEEGTETETELDQEVGTGTGY